MLNFVVFPILFSLGISFFNWKILASERPFIGFANYTRMFTNPELWLAMKNTALYKSYTDTIKGKTPEEEMKIWETTLPLIDDGGLLFHQNVEEIKKLQDILFTKGLLKREYPVDEIFVNSYL